MEKKELKRYAVIAFLVIAVCLVIKNFGLFAKLLGVVQVVRQILAHSASGHKIIPVRRQIADDLDSQSDAAEKLGKIRFHGQFAFVANFNVISGVAV